MKNHITTEKIVTSHGFEWRPQTTEAYERALSDYILALGLSRKDLAGDILDLGSGALQYFNTQLREYGINARITSVNPDMREDKYRRELVGTEGFAVSQGYDGQTVAAIAQMLPFKDESFDRVFSLGALTSYANPKNVSEESVIAWMHEIVRVLRPEGQAYLAPIYGEDLHHLYEQCFIKSQISADICIEPVLTFDGDAVYTNDDTQRQLYRVCFQKWSLHS